MNWKTWDKIESLLNRLDIRPIVAVIPDNRDPAFQIEEPHPDYWARVASWKQRGYAIGLHGYQHVVNSTDSGFIGIHKRSEFSGLSVDEQRAKILSAVSVLRSRNIEPDVWVAPFHSFDETTLAELMRNEIRAISEGFHTYPYVDSNGLLWVPQQLWSFRRRPFGIWTVCIHHNYWKPDEFDEFERTVCEYKQRITSWAEVHSEFDRRRQSALDNSTAYCYRLIATLWSRRSPSLRAHG